MRLAEKEKWVQVLVLSPTQIGAEYITEHHESYSLMRRIICVLHKEAEECIEFIGVNIVSLTHVLYMGVISSSYRQLSLAIEENIQYLFRDIKCSMNSGH